MTASGASETRTVGDPISRTAFVTGGTGFLGGRLVARLVADGWIVRALHRAPADAARLRALGAEPVQGDLGDEASLRRGLAGAEVVFHAAALFTFWAPAAEFERANVEGTRNLLAAARAQQVRRFVQIGAAGVVMGRPRPMLDVTEDQPLAAPAWAPYLASKARSQALTLAADGVGGMRTSVVAPPMIWGAGMPMLAGLIADVRAGRFAWPGGGRARISTAHVDNVCEAAVLAAARAPGGKAYFVTDGETRTLREALSQFLAARGVTDRAPTAPMSLAWPAATLMEAAWRALPLGGQPPLTRQMLRMVGFDFTLCDARARDDLGYRPIVGWREGIEAMTAG